MLTMKIYQPMQHENLMKLHPFYFHWQWRECDESRDRKSVRDRSRPTTEEVTLTWKDRTLLKQLPAPRKHWVKAVALDWKNNALLKGQPFSTKEDLELFTAKEPYCRISAPTTYSCPEGTKQKQAMAHFGSRPAVYDMPPLVWGIRG